MYTALQEGLGSLWELTLQATKSGNIAGYGLDTAPLDG